MDNHCDMGVPNELWFFGRRQLGIGELERRSGQYTFTPSRWNSSTVKEADSKEHAHGIHSIISSFAVYEWNVPYRSGVGRARIASSPPWRAPAFQRRTLRRSTPTRRATSTGMHPLFKSSKARQRRRSNSSPLPFGLKGRLRKEV